MIEDIECLIEQISAATSEIDDSINPVLETLHSTILDDGDEMEQRMDDVNRSYIDTNFMKNLQYNRQCCIEQIREDFNQIYSLFESSRDMLNNLLEHQQQFEMLIDEINVSTSSAATDNEEEE